MLTQDKEWATIACAGASCMRLCGPWKRPCAMPGHANAVHPAHQGCELVEGTREGMAERQEGLYQGRHARKC